MIYSNYPDLGFGNPTISNDLESIIGLNLVYSNIGFGSPDFVEVNNLSYDNIIDRGFGSPFSDFTIVQQNTVIVENNIIEAGKVFLKSGERKLVNIKNKNFIKPNIICKSLTGNACVTSGYNTILHIEELSSNSFVIVNNTRNNINAGFTITETLQSLANVDTDLDGVSDLNELIDGTNPEIAYI